ncbi:MAG: hypothetical protein U0X91_21395 [Spirosomataceae bacterium]
MKRTEEELERISQYLNRQLGVDENTLFESELSTDAQLAADVEQLRLLKQAAERQQLREQIKRIQSEKLTEWQQDDTDSTTKIVPMPVKRTNFWQMGGWASAASVALLVGYFSLAEVSYEPVSMAVERSNTPSAQDTILEQLDQGIKLLKDNKPTEAITIFDQVEGAANIRAYYRDAATWYETVALLKAGKKAEAKALLRQIEYSPDFQYDIPTLDQWKVKWKLLF